MVRSSTAALPLRAYVPSCLFDTRTICNVGVKLGDVLHGDAGVGHCLVQSEVPARLESLETALVMAEYAHHPAPPFAW